MPKKEEEKSVEVAPEKIEEEVLKAVAEVKVELVFDPPWNQTMMSDEARLQVGLM